MNASLAESPSTLKQALDRTVNAHLDAADRTRLERAYDLAAHGHAGQKRKHGAPYLLHPLRVALILIDEFRRREVRLLAAALLHDVLEDAPERVSAETIRHECGEDVLELVRALTSPPEADVPDKAERNRLKAQKAAAAPRSAWYVKLADRIDNLRDARALTDDAGLRFRTRYCRETLDYYLPLAERLDDPLVRTALQAAIDDLREEP